MRNMQNMKISVSEGMSVSIKTGCSEDGTVVNGVQ